MTGAAPLGREADRDPLDYSRILIAEHARRAVTYGDILRDLIELRDDDGAKVMMKRLIAEVRGIDSSFKALSAGRKEEPARAAAEHFDKLTERQAAE